jgi:hypothetical protein
MTIYHDKNRRGRKDDDVPIVASYNTNEHKEFYCKFCSRIMQRLWDSSHQNPTLYCSFCQIETNPEIDSLRSKNKLEVPEGVNQNPYASTKFPEPDLRKKKTEIKGGLAELQKRSSIKITSYTESKG